MKKIIIIDDEKDMLEMLSEALKIDDVEVHAFSDANEATKQFKSNKFDLAIVDIRLSDRSGIELIKEFSKHSPDVKIIAISGGGQLGPKGYLNMAERIGVEHTFAKPFNTSELLETVKKLL